MSEQDQNMDADQPQQSEIENIKEQLEVEKEARLRTMADFDNFRKRMESERVTFGAVTNMGLVQEIIEIYDDLQLALNDDELNLEAGKAAISSGQEKLKAAAATAGVSLIEVRVGDKFDSSSMEAISTVEDEDNKDKVVAVVSSGIKYANKEGIVRAAKVVVGKYLTKTD